MDDKTIVDLYWQRSEQAIGETDKKYGRFCYSVAYNVLASREDADESVNDTYMATWNALPPHRPTVLMSFLAKLTRRISINRWRSETAVKRGGGQVHLVLDELLDCAADGPDVEESVIGGETRETLNRFLEALPETERRVFVRRYFMLDPIWEIAENFRFSEAKVTTMLYRTRQKLRTYLEQEGVL